MQPQVSVVIPAFNEEKTIESCLLALVNQTTKTPFEVIVVDNDSTDGTGDIVKSFANRLDLYCIQEKKKGRSPARRAGFEAAKGEIIFSTDADSIVPENWIEDILQVFRKKDIVAVTGTCKIIDCSARINTTFNFFQPYFMKLYKVFRGHYWLSGFNFAIRKDAYVQSGRFDPDLNSQEDVELAVRVAKIGKIQFMPKPVVVFSGRRFRRGLIRGLSPYVKSYCNLFIFSNTSRTKLSDER